MLPSGLGSTGTFNFGGSTRIVSPLVTDRMRFRLQFTRDNGIGGTELKFGFGLSTDDRLDPPIVSPPTKKGFLVKTETAPYIPQVFGVSWVGVWCRAKDLGSAPPFMATALHPWIRSGASDWVGDKTTIPDLGAAYADYDPALLKGLRVEQDPATGQPWTYAAALAAQVGFKDGSGSAVTHESRITAVKKRLLVNHYRDRNNAVAYERFP